MKWLREIRNIYPDELQLLDEALTNFYSNPPKAYHEVATAANENLNDKDHIFHRRIISHAYPGAKVLDVGCGNAITSPWFTEKGACYTGVDISREQLEVNKKKYPKCDFLEMHWRDIHTLGDVFDIVTSFFTLEHIVYPREFLEASALCVKPGGFLALLCPDYLDRGFLPSQHFFGRKPGGIKDKTRRYQWIAALIEVVDRYIIFPVLIRKARLMSKNGGAWLINLRPLCLETESWKIDWDAVYMVGEDEVTNYIETLGFNIVERGAMLRKTDNSETCSSLCYILAQKPVELCAEEIKKFIGKKNIHTNSLPIFLLKAVARITIDILGFLPYVRHIQKRIDCYIHTKRQNRLNPEEIETIYTTQYHKKHHYGRFDVDDSGWEPDAVIKLAHARSIMQVLPHIKKVLIGGCSSGMGIFAFRQINVQAYGFEISPDLDRMVLPEVKDYIRSGSMIDIPFDANDNFDCFLTTDVLEHVQLKNINCAFREMARINCTWMVHLINHTDIRPDHMTLKPLKWWAKQASPYYRLRSDLQAPVSDNPRIYGLNGDPLHVYTFWERI